jgi:uncharacterized membrane protein HdeD (DUF308 family)
MKRNTLARNLFLIVAMGYFLLGVLFVLTGVRNSNSLLYIIGAVAFLVGVGHVYLAARKRKAG